MDVTPTTQTADPSAPLRVGRAAVIGAAVGFVVFSTLITIGSYAAGNSLGGSLGLGVFAGFWGGLGFGFMIGGTMYVSLTEDHARRRMQREADARADTTAARTPRPPVREQTRAGSMPVTGH